MDDFPDPIPRKHPPIMDHSFAALGWLHRAAQAVGSPRFAESLGRARFYTVRAAIEASTPAEVSVVNGLIAAEEGLVEADADARRLLAESVSGMDAAEACEFVEMCESDEPGMAL